jgi:hypothetical protein
VDVELRGGVPAMRPVALTLAALAIAGCHPAYQMPSLAEPHATVKLRIAYHDSPRTQLEQVVLINGHQPEVPPPVTLPGEISRAIPIRLEGTRLDVRTAFYHLITIMQTHTQSYSCGTNGMMCTRVVTVPVTTRINDATCEQAAGLGPQQDAVYLVQYDFYAHARCTLQCLREWPQPDGTFRNTACEPAPAK